MKSCCSKSKRYRPKHSTVIQNMCHLYNVYCRMHWKSILHIFVKTKCTKMFQNLSFCIDCELKNLNQIWTYSFFGTQQFFYLLKSLSREGSNILKTQLQGEHWKGYFCKPTLLYNTISVFWQHKNLSPINSFEW
jgi:hypothetical protein